jgi:Outer membrane protein beta-barrel domain
MKHVRIALLSGLTMLVMGAAAQEQKTVTENSISSKFGIRAGVNLTNLYVDDVDDENMKVGLNAGVYAKLPVTKGISIQPELNYSSKGAKLTYNNILQGKGEYRYNLNYIELPVLAVFNVGKNFNLHAGGYAAYLVDANIKDLNDDGTVQGIADFNTDNFNRFDYGVVGGLGFDIQNVTLGARYNYGLNEIGEKGLSGQLTKNSKNAGFNFFIGLAF